jgi:hypothetical protein
MSQDGQWNLSAMTGAQPQGEEAKRAGAVWTWIRSPAADEGVRN